MHVVEGNGRIGVIVGWQVVSGVSVMYDLEVANDHTFTVGDGAWVVHNCSGTLTDPTARRAAESVTNAFNDHLTDSDLSGAWRDLHGNPVPKPSGGYYDHLGEVNNALTSGRKAIGTFKQLLQSGALSEADRCIVQCLLSTTSSKMDYVEKVISRDTWYPGTTVLPFP